MKNKIKKKKHTILKLLLIICMLVSSCAVANAETTSLSKVNLAALQSSDTSMTLSWKKVSGATGYEVYRKISGTGSYNKIKTITSGSTVSYKNTGLSLGKTYYYKVRAYKVVDGKKVYGSYSNVKSRRVTYLEPKYSVYLPSSMDKGAGTIVISITNNSKSDNSYFDGVFAIEIKGASGSKVYNAYAINFSKPEQGLSGKLAQGKRLILRPGEKVRFTCLVEGDIDYDKANAVLTTCIRYKSKDFVGIYSLETGNKVFTAEEFWDEIN